MASSVRFGALEIPADPAPNGEPNRFGRQYRNARRPRQHFRQLRSVRSTALEAASTAAPGRDGFRPKAARPPEVRPSWVGSDESGAGASVEAGWSRAPRPASTAGGARGAGPVPVAREAGSAGSPAGGCAPRTSGRPPVTRSKAPLVTRPVEPPAEWVGGSSKSVGCAGFRGRLAGGRPDGAAESARSMCLSGVSAGGAPGRCRPSGVPGGRRRERRGSRDLVHLPAVHQ